MVAGALVAVLLALPTFSVHAQSSSAAPGLEIGYAPGMLFPTSGGTPVFSAGDQFWVKSDYNSTVTVAVGPFTMGPIAMNGTMARQQWGLPPGRPVELFSFNSTSPQGFWVIYFASSPSVPSVIFIVSNSATSPTGLTLSGDKLVEGSLTMNFTTSSSLALYSGEACVLGRTNTTGVVVSVPGQLGGGSVLISRRGNTLSLAGQGLGKANFSISAELYYSYSFLAPNSTAILLTRSIRVASAPGVLVYYAPGLVVAGGSRLPSLTLREDAPLKPGRYQLRIFFEGTGGTLLSTADVLIPGGDSWVWLGQCANFPVYSNKFGLTVPIGGDPNTWPRTVWLTYAAYGQQGWAQVPLNIQLATVNFVSEPWGVKLSSYRIDLNSTVGIIQAESFNGTAYVILGSAQGTFDYGAGLGTRNFFTGISGPLLPFSSANVMLNVSRIVATYLSRGVPYQGARVTLSDAKGNISSGLTNLRGTVDFFAPPGTYSLAGAGGNSSSRTTFTLLPAQSLDVTLGGPSSSSVDLGTMALITAVAVGVVANVIVYIRRNEF